MIMIDINDSVGVSTMEQIESDAAARIGKRIRTIREMKHISQGELGEKVGLTADRIQKYENGARKPRQEMLITLAKALGVSVLALTDPVVDNSISLMYVLFELERKFELKFDKVSDSELGLCFKVTKRDDEYKALMEWYERYSVLEAEWKALDLYDYDGRLEILEKYRNWQWNYPAILHDDKELEIRKNLLQQKIKSLQEAYDLLDSHENI